MPTARELLEQADALMRRNRGDADIPVLTDSVTEATMPLRGGPSTRERTGPVIWNQAIEARAPRDMGQREDRKREPEGPRSAVSPPQDILRAVTPPSHLPDALSAPVPDLDASDVEPPLLTDVVAEDEASVRPPPLAADQVDQSLWLGPDTIDPALHSITGPAPDTLGVVPPVTVRAPDPVIESSPVEEGRDPTVTRTLRAAGSAPTPPPAGSTPAEAVPDVPVAAAAESAVTAVTESAAAAAAEPAVTATASAAAAAAEPAVAVAAIDEAQWRALAEQISMQVLQRLDLFVDTGLKAQLASHLQPIVARAGAELVEAINDHVGQLVRTYIAEAIEREIVQWRQQNK